ncbi:cellulase family glycosylhydrolase [Nocardioidaceae bacterium]|nr:cellulase family glycosylhydrolase [Nocardioidaceae bacterium]
MAVSTAGAVPASAPATVAPAATPATPATPAATTQVATTALPAVAARRGPRPVRLGVQFHGLWSHQTPLTRGRTLDMIKESGARWVRLDVSWAMIQPREGSYDLVWGVPKVDTAIQEARARGLKVLVTFWLTPGWANGNKGERVGPDDPSDYAKALAWAVKRWKGEVRAWEVWNEQNSSDFFRSADPVEYTRLLCAAHRQTKATGVKHKLLYGGVMYNDSGFIRRTYEAGARNCFDILSTHPYMAPSDAHPGLPDDGTIWRLRHLESIRRLQAEFRDRTPIWATEFGWSAHRNTGGEQNWNRGVSEETQADYATLALRILQNDYPYVRKAFWYNDVMRTDGDPQLNGFGMLRPDYSPRPLWNAFRAMLG